MYLLSQHSIIMHHIRDSRYTERSEVTMWENAAVGLDMMWANHPYWIGIFVATVVAGIVVNVYHWMKEE